MNLKIRNKHDQLIKIVKEEDMAVIACSAGIDSLLLAILFNRVSRGRSVVYHTVSPAVQKEATKRLVEWSNIEKFNLRIIRSGEFQDSRYTNNPKERCYYCKINLYSSILEDIERLGEDSRNVQLFSGANKSDLGEYRPGLIAAEEYDVRHPYIESDIEKEDIRVIARGMELPFSELPASPCLSSRVYTGNEIKSSILWAVEAGEKYLRDRLSIGVSRCRFERGRILIEVSNLDRSKITEDVIKQVEQIVKQISKEITDVYLDPLEYKPGRSFRIS